MLVVEFLLMFNYIFKVVSEVDCPYSTLFNYLWKPEEYLNINIILQIILLHFRIHLEFFKYSHPSISDIHVLKTYVAIFEEKKNSLY